MRLIPAIDLIDGQCVRLEQGDYAKQTTYHADPLEVARSFADHGLQYLHLVDLDGAKAGHVINWRVLERITTHTSLHVDVGGGVKSDEDLRIVFECGAKQVNVGSLAVKEPTKMRAWIAAHGGDRIILSADVRERHIAVAGWQEQTQQPVVDFIARYLEAGLQTAVVTDIAKDGMLAGPSFELYHELLSELPALKLVASGGVTSLQDLDQLAERGLDGAIIGKAIYEGRITLPELSRWGT
jgi:phosphoribosylformimino-5-aminoimidazole carboxamide ribotide isomerase